MKFDANGWLDVAQEIDYSANSMDRQGYGIKYLVLHGTAGGASAQGVGQFFQGTIGGSNPVSSHIIIDQQGNIVQGVPLSLAAFGNGVITNGHAAYLPDPSINPNWYTASIEFVKASIDNSDALTAIQAEKGFEVIQCICDTYTIPKRAGDANGGIISHADIDPVNRSRCPGAFPWQELWAHLAAPNGGQDMPLQITDPFAATHFTQNTETSWHCTNGIDVHGSILAYYRKTQGAMRLPRTPEIPGIIPGGVLQVFEGGVLVWDPGYKVDDPGQGDVYAMHLDQDSPGLRRLMALAGLQAATVTIEQVNTVMTAMKSAQASLAVGVSTLEPAVKP
jgi:N-acetyl-anhydromuramyl-L-alanine amidase AmpD